MSSNTTLNVYCPEGVKDDIIDAAIDTGETPGVYLLRLHTEEKKKRAAAITIVKIAKRRPTKTSELIMARMLVADGSFENARGEYGQADFATAIVNLGILDKIEKKWPDAAEKVRHFSKVDA